MYNPSSFKVDDPDILFELITAHNFGLIFSQHTEVAEVTHLPFLVDRSQGDKGVLIAHFARANKHWKQIDPNKELLCVFQGPQTYISPSWYIDRETVPTWNYATVHVRGQAKLIHNPSELRAMVTQLTHQHEAQVDSDWDLSEGESMMETDLKAIVGIIIEITHLEGKFKFNQNRSKEDQQSVITHLDKKGDSDVSTIMKKNLKTD